MFRDKIRVIFHVTVFILLSVYLPVIASQTKPAALFSVYSDASSYYYQPVKADLAGLQIQSHNESWQFFEITGGINEPVQFQFIPGHPYNLTWILSGKTEPGSVRNFELKIAGSSKSFDNSSEKVTLTNDGKIMYIHRG